MIFLLLIIIMQLFFFLIKKLSREMLLGMSPQYKIHWFLNYPNPQILENERSTSLRYSISISRDHIGPGTNYDDW